MGAGQQSKEMKNMVIHIGDKKIGYGHPCFIIAEAGVNHNGELKKALELVDIAAESGADAVKFQTFNAEDVVTGVGEMAQYQKKNIGKTLSQIEMLRSLELKESDWPKIIERCKKKKIIFMSTPHGGRASVSLLQRLGVKAFKVGSGDLNNYLLLESLAKTGKPIILSSGMATMKETVNAVNFIKSNGNKKIAIFHCTTNYPCPLNEVNLLAMKTMMRILDIPIGYSDHTEGIEVAIMALTLGALLYECHFTIDKTLPGPDHIASSSPEELSERIKAIRNVPLILGSDKKVPTPSEFKNMKKTIRKSIVAVSDLAKGHKIKIQDLAAKRPGDGLSPDNFKKVLGKTLIKSIKYDHKILMKDLK